MSSNWPQAFLVDRAQKEVWPSGIGSGRHIDLLRMVLRENQYFKDTELEIVNSPQEYTLFAVKYGHWQWSRDEHPNPIRIQVLAERYLQRQWANGSPGDRRHNLED